MACIATAGCASPEKSIKLSLTRNCHRKTKESPKFPHYSDWTHSCHSDMASRDITYEPINTESKDIRLLRLSDRSVQGLPSSEIFHDRRVEGGPVCEIFHASLDDGVQYEALSYSWGDARLRETIMVNGNPTSVTINLARALEDIRFDVGTRILWVMLYVLIRRIRRSATTK